MSDHRPVALVTGGSRGIGRATVERFLAAGYRVAAWAHTDASLDELRTALAPAVAAGRVLPQKVDVRRQEAVATGLTELIAAYERLDVAVNNAGWTETHPFLQEDSEYWRTVVDTNLWGSLFVCHAALSQMVRQGEGGAVVNVVSDAARVGMAGEAVYAASKAAVIALTKSLAQEMARYGIRLNCVSPGPTRTRILEDNTRHQPGHLIERMIQRIPQRRVAEPEEIAAAIYFLAGPDAGHITGQVLSVSGGLTMV